MPKFTESEFEAIQNLLFEKGKELFIEYGLKKTSIDEIVNATNIAKGSFYKFYSSKEELYFAILKKEEEDYHTILENVIQSTQNGPELMTRLIMEIWDFYKTNVFLQLFFERKEMSLLLRKIPLEEIQAYSDEQRLYVIRSIEILQKDKRIVRTIEPSVIEGIVRSILILSIHKQEIGETVYEDVMDTIVRLVGNGLG